MYFPFIFNATMGVRDVKLKINRFIIEKGIPEGIPRKEPKP